MAEVKVTTEEVKGLKVRVRKYFPPHRSGGEAKDIDYLIELVAIALEDHQDRLGITKSKRLVVRSQWPKDEVESPGQDLTIVTQRVISRKPGNTSPDRERRPMKPAMRQDPEPHPEQELRDAGYKVVTSGWWMDNVLEYRVQSANVHRADELALFFQNFMEAYQFYFKDTGGIQFMRFEERREDIKEKIGGTEVYVRPIRYFVRTELISHAVLATVDSVRVQYDAGPRVKREVVDEDLGISDYSVDRGVAPGEVR